MKSNKTGSHITIRAPNGHWHGSNLFFLCFCRKMGKSHQLQTHKKRGVKASCYLARSAANCMNKKDVRSVQSAAWHWNASHFNKKGQFFCEKVLSPLHSGQAEKCLNNLIFILSDMWLCVWGCAGALRAWKSGSPPSDLQGVQLGLKYKCCIYLTSWQICIYLPFFQPHFHKKISQRLQEVFLITFTVKCFFCPWQVSYSLKWQYSLRFPMLIFQKKIGVFATCFMIKR